MDRCGRYPFPTTLSNPKTPNLNALFLLKCSRGFGQGALEICIIPGHRSKFIRILIFSDFTMAHGRGYIVSGVKMGVQEPNWGTDGQKIYLDFIFSDLPRAMRQGAGGTSSGGQKGV